MIVYVLSSPDDVIIMMTTNRTIVDAARKAAKGSNDKLEVMSWDTEKSPICTINVRVEQAEPAEQEEPAEREPGNPPSRVLP
jgi:hypothetical protein